MSPSVFARALTLGAFTLLTAQHAFAEEADTDTIKYPYKAVGETVIFQYYRNVDPQLVPDVDVRDFKIIYKGYSISVARSGKNYYCDALKLPAGFDPAQARFVEDFVLFSGKAWADCKPLDYAIDAEKFKALDNPFYTDSKTVLLVTGERMKDVDVATFKTLSMHQANDKSHYYFVAGNHVKLPYHHSVKTYPPCYGWGNIDGTMHYEGKPRPEVDSKSFACFASYTAIDKHDFYVTRGKAAQVVIPEDVNVQEIKMLTEEIYSDGKYVWFVGREAMLLSGINASKVSWKKKGSVYRITDGDNRWKCAVSNDYDEPVCDKR